MTLRQRTHFFRLGFNSLLFIVAAYRAFVTHDFWWAFAAAVCLGAMGISLGILTRKPTE